MRIEPHNFSYSQINTSRTEKTHVSFGVSQKTIGAKIVNGLEFDSFNFSTLGLALICYLTVLFPRYIKARDNDEKREILIRDLISISVMLFGRRVIQNIVAEICTRHTGLALRIKPDRKTTKLGRIFDYLKPDNGIKVLTSKQIEEKYFNIQDYKNGLAGFAEFINGQGGDIKKVLTSFKPLAENLQQTHKDWSSPNKSKNFATASADEILTMLKDLKKEENPNLKSITDYLNNSNNELLKKAKSINPIFDFVTTLLAIPALLGFFLPYFNEQVTKKIHSKINENSKI